MLLWRQAWIRHLELSHLLSGINTELLFKLGNDLVTLLHDLFEPQSLDMLVVLSRNLKGLLILSNLEVFLDDDFVLRVNDLIQDLNLTLDKLFILQVTVTDSIEFLYEVTDEGVQPLIETFSGLLFLFLDHVISLLQLKNLLVRLFFSLLELFGHLS